MADLVFLETFSRQIGLYIVRRLGIHPPEQIGEVRGCFCRVGIQQPPEGERMNRLRMESAACFF